MKFKIFILLTVIALFVFPVFFINAQQPTGTSKTSGGVTPTIDYSCKATNPDCKVGGLFFDPTNKDDVECACCGECKLANFTNTAVMVAKSLLGLVGSLALLMFVYGGVMWIFSGGDPEKVQKGRKILTGAVIGVIIVLGAYTLVNFAVQALTGMNINEIQNWKTQPTTTTTTTTTTQTK